MYDTAAGDTERNGDRSLRSSSREKNKVRGSSDKSSRSDTKHRSRSRSRTRSHKSSRREKDRGPRSIRELREERQRRKARRQRDSTQQKRHNSQFDVPPDPNAPPAAITKSLQLAQQTSSQTGVALSSVLSSELVAPKHAKSIYVGGFDPSRTDEKEMFDFFNDTINLVTSKQLDPVVSVYLNKSKGFGFVELKDYNLASAVIQNLNGVVFKGNPLSLRRPTNYDPSRCPPPGPQPSMDVSKIGLKSGRPSTYVENVPEKIYVAGIPPTVSDDQLQELLEAFGPLESMCVVRDRGYAFCLYQDKSKTDIACMGLNGIALGTQILTVKRADVQARPVNTDLNLSDPSVVAKMLPSGGGLEAFGMDPSNGKKAAATGLIGNTAPGGLLEGSPEPLKPSRVLVLKNMLTEAELRDEGEYRDIFADIRTECGSYGKVLSLDIPRPGERGVGKAFVEFEKEVDALTAKQNLEGRMFADRTVVCQFLSEENYRSRIYD